MVIKSVLFVCQTNLLVKTGSDDHHFGAAFREMRWTYFSRAKMYNLLNGCHILCESYLQKSITNKQISKK